MSKSFKVIFFIIVAFLFVGIGVIAYLYFEPVKIIARQKTDIFLLDTDLMKDFNENEKLAAKKYENKIIELTGIVKKTEIKDSICTVIFDNGGNYIIVANCDYNTKNDIQQLHTGGKATLKGIYSGYVINDETFMIPAEIKIDKCTLAK